jgi:hypothetical protein
VDTVPNIILSLNLNGQFMKWEGNSKDGAEKVVKLTWIK